MALYLRALKAVFNAFYNSFFEKLNKISFFKKTNNCSLNHLYLLSDKQKLVRLEVFRRTDVSHNLKKMMLKHIIAGLLFGISSSFISWIVGMIINAILAKTKYYQKISNFNFIKSETINKNIGI